MPELTLISGPDGAGKTTLSHFLLSKKYLDSQIALINPDEIQIQENTDEFMASKKALVLREKLLIEKANFSIETTFSGNSELRLVQRAKSLDYRTRIYFITTLEPQICIDRIKYRVVEGGHNIDDEDVLRRYERSHQNFLNTAHQIDDIFVFDNSFLNRRFIFSYSNKKPKVISKRYQSPFYSKLLKKFEIQLQPSSTT